MASFASPSRAPLGAVLLLVPTLLAAQTAPSNGHAAGGPGLVEPAELIALIPSDATVVLHVGGSLEDWSTGHIPGSRYLPVGDFTRSEGEYAEPGSIQMNLPFDLDDARSAFARLGVSDGTDRIVVTYPSSRQFTLATRAIWTLDVLGLGDRTFLLNGGHPGWVAAGGAVDALSEDGRTFTPFAAGPDTPDLSAEPRPEGVVDLGWMTQFLEADSLQVIDARNPASYSGEREEFPGRAGHIPGAGSLPIEQLLEEDGRFVGATTIANLLRDAGVQEGDRVVTYCHIGQRASAAWFAATLAGFDAAIYDGSMNEWGRTSLPLETGGR